jgi:hypothetical protein
MKRIVLPLPCHPEATRVERLRRRAARGALICSVLLAAAAPAYSTVSGGNLEVTKVVDWKGVAPDTSQTFEICIAGPTYPNGTEAGACQTADFDGATLIWNDVDAGMYTVTETNPGALWSVSISGSPADVQEAQTATAEVTNTFVADVGLNLTAECRVGDTLYWRVTGDDDVDGVPFTWNGPGSNDGSGSVDAGDRQYFTTVWVPSNPNTTILTWFDPADDRNESKTKAHNNAPCIYHVTFEKVWNGAAAPDLDGATLFTASSSLGTASCTSDDGALSCTYSTGDDLHVPFGETYSVSEPSVPGWNASSGTGSGFTGIEGYDPNALPDDLVFDVADDRFCQSNPNAEFPFNLEIYCDHTVTNDLGVTPTASATATATATPTATATATLIFDGEACEDPDDCMSGNCVDDVCCESTCDGPMEACNIAGSEGMCVAVAAGAPATSPAGSIAVLAVLLATGALALARRRRSA